MTRALQDLAQLAGEHAITIVKSAKTPYFLKTWDGNLIGPFDNVKAVKVWLAGYSVGANAHNLDCSCGRVACNHRNAVLNGEAQR